MVHYIPMDKVSFVMLWDIYRALLTPVQQEITDLYFNLDLTLSEIAEQKNTSRQSVHACLKTCEKLLEEYENKLQFGETLQKYGLEFSFKLTDARRWAENFKQAHPEFSEDIGALDAILLKDYSEEVQEKLKDPAMIELLNKDYTQQVFGRSKTGEE